VDRPSPPSSIGRLRRALSAVVRGKEDVIDRLLVGVLAGGHVLVEDVPGVGKTTLAKALARALDLNFSRVQFTPDLLPSDILGSHVLDPRDGTLTFKSGPIFTHVLLADEINRASPRTQSALLEAMNEGQITIDGSAMKLPEPFLVLATQNPSDFQGTYPLPEAQLDRFVLRLQVGYPPLEDEVAMLFDRRVEDPLDDVTRVLARAEFIEIRQRVRAVEVKPAVAKYLASICSATRDAEPIALGASPRATLAYFRACQARAFMAERSYVSPVDVQALAGAVLGHRIELTDKARHGGRSTEQVIADVVARVPVPT